ncbi:UNVERIFIED_CONTAM: hypothetical protein K2H54_056603, partial [Gekko kuhli]
IDLDDVVAINPDLFTTPVIAAVNENLPIRDNVTTQRQTRRATLSKIPAPREALRLQPSKMSVIAESQNSPLENEMEVESSASVPTRSRSALPARRKSNIVKEMEKMKSKREEKRAQFSEIRNKRTQEFDSNCPNWEFGRMVKEYRATIDCRPISMHDPIEEHRICVCVRKRPLNKKELGKKECDIITVANRNTILVHEPKAKVDLTKYLENQAFRFDFSFDETASNEMVYR